MANARLVTVENFSDSWEEMLFRQSRKPEKTNPDLKCTIIMPSTDQAPTLRREFLIYTPCEGVSYIASVAENAGWDTKIIDLRMGGSVEEAARMAADRGGVLAMPTFVDSVPENIETLHRARELNPNLQIVIGGALVSSLPGPIAKAMECDYAVLNEGELPWLELLYHIKDGKTKDNAKHIAGLLIRFSDDKVMLTPPRAQVTTLDSVPIPNLHLYPSIAKHPEIPEMGLTSARGCYARCTFCFVNIPKMRFKSIQRCDEELEYLVKHHGTDYLYLNDLTFTADMKRTMHLCDVLAKHNIQWSCSTRVEKCTPEILKKMKDAGCQEIWYGVESLDQTILDITNKRQTVKQIEDAVNMTVDAGITVMANLIVGLPGESEASIAKMIDFVVNSPVIPASIKYLTPFPGTPIYEDAIKKGIVKDHIEYLNRLAKRRVNDINDELYNLTDLSDERLREAFVEITRLKNERIEAARKEDSNLDNKMKRTDGQWASYEDKDDSKAI